MGEARFLRGNGQHHYAVRSDAYRDVFFATHERREQVVDVLVGSDEPMNGLQVGTSVRLDHLGLSEGDDWISGSQLGTHRLSFCAN
jgi:hypothetical protein